MKIFRGQMIGPQPYNAKSFVSRLRDFRRATGAQGRRQREPLAAKNIATVARYIAVDVYPFETVTQLLWRHCPQRLAQPLQRANKSATVNTFARLHACIVTARGTIVGFSAPSAAAGLIAFEGGESVNEWHRTGNCLTESTAHDRRAHKVIAMWCIGVLSPFTPHRYQHLLRL